MSVKIDKGSLTIGGDPEVFLFSKEENRFVSAINKIPGSKDDPYRLFDFGLGFALQTDCCSVEFNIPPANNSNEYYANIKQMLEYIQNIIPAGLSISLATSAKFTDEELMEPQAMLAGCSVDYNAWAGAPNDKPDFESTNIRCNGAHIHIGYDSPNDVASLELIKALDLTLGVTSVIFDSDKERRKLYGRAGCFRPTSFGVEYRVLSPFWLESKELVEYIFRGIDKAVDLVNSGKEYDDIEQLDIQNCINNSDHELAVELIKKYDLGPLLPINKLMDAIMAQ